MKKITDSQVRFLHEIKSIATIDVGIEQLEEKLTKLRKRKIDRISKLIDDMYRYNIMNK